MSDIQGLGGDVRGGFETGGQRESKAEERDERRVADAESVGSLEKDSRGGSEVVTVVAKEEGERERRLRRAEEIGA